MSNQSLYAMYVIGAVESNHNWAAVNPSDPITLGMMQWYGTRAYGLLNRGRMSDPDGWATFKAADPSLAAHVENNDITWTSYYPNGTDSAAWKKWSATDANHAFQQAQWNDDFTSYQTVCDNYGFPAANIKQRIFFMSMYHQSPARAIHVLGTTSATASLSLLHSAALNDSVLGQYTNRYNTAYSLLNSWDGTSAPPDFGQSDDGSTANPGGNGPGISGTTDSLAWIKVQGNNLILFDNGKKRIFWKSSAQNYQEKGTVGTPVNPGDQTNPGSDSGADAGDKVAAWVKSRIGKFAYSQAGGRLDPDATGYTDCSGLWWRAYMDVTGIDVGTWTGAQKGKGRRIAISTSSTIEQAIAQAHAGDLVLIAWTASGVGNYDHVEGFESDGGSMLLSHGGPGNGPHEKSAQSQMGAAYLWEVRRYL